MAKARAIPELTEDTRFGAAAAQIVAVRAAELVEHSRDVLDTSDIERVHDMRVATRRLRAALEVFGSCFPKKRHRAVLDDVKELADALGERRDRDVAITLLEDVAAAMAAPDRRGIQSLVSQLRQEQDAANRALRPVVDEKRLGRLARRLDELVVAADEKVSAG